MSDKPLILGVRHHGPGSARSVVAALDEAHPDVVLIEGPEEASSLVPFLLESSPPVAMLFYNPENQRHAVFYPFAEFSPELQAIRWAHRNGSEVRFMDLPASALLGLRVVRDVGNDALARLSEAAGFEDFEDWWEQLVELRRDTSTVFEGLENLMRELRSEPESPEIGSEPDDSHEDGLQTVSGQEYERLREDHMRSCLTAAGPKAAVVCGAWHAPALREQRGPKQKLPKVPVSATLVPWTYERLTSMSGYGAGAQSPAFYELLWTTPAEEVTRKWLITVARLMRDEDLDASPASVIEAVRLSEALASLRGRPTPGLRELREAAASVLVRDDSIWNLIGRRLIVGERMGSVPESAPSVPLQLDLQAQQKRLRLPVDDTDRKLELDLRKENDLERSRLLHRLLILSIGWGSKEQVSGRKGTFHEHWRIQWKPELALAVIEASPLGNTVETASTNRAISLAEQAQELARVAVIVEGCLLADLEMAIGPVVQRLLDVSATATDVSDLAKSLPPLVGALRYGTVRKTEADRLEPVVEAIFVRLCVGLPGSCTSLNDESAGAMCEHLTGTASIVRVFEDESKTNLWLDTLRAVAEHSGVHPRVVGRAERLRFDFGVITGSELAQRLASEASVGASAVQTAAFVEGLLEGSGALLLHEDALWHAVDEWIDGLGSETFDEILPLIRRTFALFSKAERRQLGEKAAGGATKQVESQELDLERAELVLPVIRRILGI